MKQLSVLSLAFLFFAAPLYAEPTSNNKENEPVPAEEFPSDSTGFCFTLHEPMTCDAIYGGEYYSAPGTNRCVAMRNLVKEVNGRYLWFIPVHAEDLQELQCY